MRKWQWVLCTAVLGLALVSCESVSGPEESWKAPAGQLPAAYLTACDSFLGKGISDVRGLKFVCAEQLIRVNLTNTYTTTTALGWQTKDGQRIIGLDGTEARITGTPRRASYDEISQVSDRRTVGNMFRWRPNGTDARFLTPYLLCRVGEKEKAAAMFARLPRPQFLSPLDSVTLLMTSNAIYEACESFRMESPELAIPKVMRAAELETKAKIILDSKTAALKKDFIIDFETDIEPDKISMLELAESLRKRISQPKPPFSISMVDGLTPDRKLQLWFDYVPEIVPDMNSKSTQEFVQFSRQIRNELLLPMSERITHDSRICRIGGQARNSPAGNSLASAASVFDSLVSRAVPGVVTLRNLRAGPWSRDAFLEYIGQVKDLSLKDRVLKGIKGSTHDLSRMSTLLSELQLSYKSNPGGILLPAFVETANRPLEAHLTPQESMDIAKSIRMFVEEWKPPLPIVNEDSMRIQIALQLANYEGASCVPFLRKLEEQHEWVRKEPANPELTRKYCDLQQVFMIFGDEAAFEKYAEALAHLPKYGFEPGTYMFAMAHYRDRPEIQRASAAFFSELGRRLLRADENATRFADHTYLSWMTEIPAYRDAMVKVLEPENEFFLLSFATITTYQDDGYTRPISRVVRQGWFETMASIQSFQPPDEDAKMRWTQERLNAIDWLKKYREDTVRGGYNVWPRYLPWPK